MRCLTHPPIQTIRSYISFLSPIGLAMEQALIIVIIIYVYIHVCTDYGLFHTHDYN